MMVTMVMIDDGNGGRDGDDDGGDGDVAKACLKYTTKESLAIKAKSIIRDSIEGVLGEKVFRTLKNVRQK